MTGFALTLILIAAFVHATWNLLAKRAGGGVAFVWLFATLSVILYAPLAIAVIAFQRPHMGAIELLFILGSTIIHIGYFLLLQRGYRTGDLSLVYPLARGTGPLLATVAAIAFLGERPTAIALTGAVLVAIGIFGFIGDLRKLRNRNALQAIAYACLTGVLIAMYTLWDKYAVSVLLVPPLLYDWSSNLGRAGLLTPIALRQWAEVRWEWRTHRLEALGIALLSPLSYILVLIALVFSPVSYIAPTREISILIGTVMGTYFLREENVLRRLIAASGMVLGVVVLAIG